MSKKISDKDKKDWEDYLSRNEHLPNKDSDTNFKKIKKTVSTLDLHGLNLNNANRAVEDLINNVKFSVIRLLMNFDKSLITQSTKKVDKVKTIENSTDKVGRNDPCPLGCGIKYKKCGIDKKCKKISETN